MLTIEGGREQLLPARPYKRGDILVINDDNVYIREHPRIFTNPPWLGILVEKGTTVLILELDEHTLSNMGQIVHEWELADMAFYTCVINGTICMVSHRDLERV